MHNISDYQHLAIDLLRTNKKTILKCAVFASLLAAVSVSLASSVVNQHRHTITLGILDIERESTYLNRKDNVQQETIDWLKERLPQYELSIQALNISTLADKIKKGEIDAFLSSSGFFVEMFPYGVKDLATLASEEFPNPNQCVGGSIIVLKSRKDLNSIDDLKGKIAVSTNPENFMAFQLGMSAIAAKGYEPWEFFKKTYFTKNEPREVLQQLLNGKSDVALLRACFLESMISKEPHLQGKFKVIEPVENHSACQYSTKLYPGWTMAVTSHVAPQTATDLAEALLAKPSFGKPGYRWSIATNYRSVTEVFRQLKIGPYAYLNNWTLERLWNTYWPYIVLFIVVAAAWVFHWLSIERLVKKRTAELQNALKVQAEFHEQALSAAAQVEKLTKFGVINELSAMYAHELAQPLTSIGYLTRTIRNTTARLSDSLKEKTAIQKLIIKMENDLNKSQSIISQIRQYAKAPIKRDAKINITKTLHEVIAKTSKIYPKIEFIINAKDSATVPGDALELFVMSLNLIRNAAESTSDGKVEISVRKFSDARLVLLEVSNAGQPLQMNSSLSMDENLENIKHHALLNISSTKSHGMGMGLLIVQSILKAHHGALHYKVNNGRIVFTAVLPASEDPT